MSSMTQSIPIEDSVPKVNSELAVGEDVAFQRRWWRFEKFIWIIFLLIIAGDISGLFGRGPLAQAHIQTTDGALDMKYERIEREGTPSMLRIVFGAAAIHNGAIKLWVSDSALKQLGNQRIAPQPAASIVGNGGVEYTFPATEAPASVTFALQPSAPGIYKLKVALDGSPDIQTLIVVMP
jgi:hypothetical protein